MPGFGESLRQAREARGLSRRSVAEATKVRENILTALEDESYADLPAPVYARGLIRTVARHLDLDAERLVGLYEEAVPPSGPPAEPDPAIPLEPLRFPWLTADLLIGAAIAIVLLLAGVWGVTQYLTQLAQPARGAAGPAAIATPQFALDPTRAAPTAAPSPSPETTPTPLPGSAAGSTPAAAAIEVRLEIIARAWLLVEVDGEHVFQGILEAGAERAFTAQKRLTMRTGNGGGVLLFLNGQPQGAMGVPGSVVDRQWELDEQNAVVATPPTWTRPPR